MNLMALESGHQSVLDGMDGDTEIMRTMERCVRVRQINQTARLVGVH
jgi:hypothetical protein